MLEVNGLVKQYGAERLGFPDFALKPGELLWLKGDSGTGKTTLLHLIAGLLQADAGSIQFKGQELAKLAAKAYDKFRRQHIGMIFQSPYLHPALTVSENLQLASSLKNVPLGISQDLGLDPFMNKKPAQLSGGQAQRAAVARGLLGKTPLLLADEPTASLDPKNFALVMDALKKACGAGRAVLLSSHDPRTEAFADRILELNTQSV